MGDKNFNFFPFFLRFLSQSFVGLLGGVTIDYGFEKLIDKIKDENINFEGHVFKLVLFGLAFFQLLTSFLFIYILIKILPNSIYKNWQNTISGLAFPALYYGTQSTMFDNIKSIYRHF